MTYWIAGNKKPLSLENFYEILYSDKIIKFQTELINSEYVLFFFIDGYFIPIDKTEKREITDFIYITKFES